MPARNHYRGAQTAEDLFEQALALEETDAAAAIHAYQRCIDADPGHIGRAHQLRPAATRRRPARTTRRRSIARRVNSGSEDVNLFFNLALVLEDTGRELEAIDLYRRAGARTRLRGCALQPGAALPAAQHAARARSVTGTSIGG